MSLLHLTNFATWTRLSGNHDDDWVDCLNHIWTVSLLVVFGLFTAGGLYFSEHINCYAEEIGASAILQKYANYICWINNTYYVPMHEDIPSRPTDKMELEIPYYQYVPLILLLMALLFKIPGVIWRSLSGYSGIDLNKIAELTVTAHYAEDNARAKKINEIAVCVDRWLESTRQYHWNCFVRLRQIASKFCFLLNRREGTYLVGLYLIVKIFYAVNVIGQFYLLDAFLGGFFSLWGIEAIDSFTVHGGFRESHRFPRVTLCDFQIRQMANVNTFTVLCVLPMNIFNEKVFLFLWYWLVLVAAVTSVNLLFWACKTLFRNNRIASVKKYLTIRSRLHTEFDKKICRKFASFLRDDGVFLIRMIEKNTNGILVTEIVNKLLDIFLEKQMMQKITHAAETHGPPLRTVN